MAGWGDKLAIACISVAAVGEAANQAVKDNVSLAPHLPKFLLSPVWSYLPLILVCLAGALWAIKHGRAIFAHPISTKSPRIIAPEDRLPLRPPPMPTPMPRSTATPGSLGVSSEKTDPQQDRVFVDVTPEYFYKLFKDNFSIHAHKIATDFIGKWMRVSGTVGDVGQIRMSGWVSLTFEYQSGQNISPVMQFRGKWIDRISVLARGTPITVIGKISQVDSTYVRLDDCELLPF